MKKALIVLLACLLVATLVVTAACNRHKWSEDWSDDATNHWHACMKKNCDERLDEAKHVDANNDGKCDVCQRNYRTPTPPVVADSVTLYFFNMDGWQDVYAYTYDDAQTELLGAWPGTKTTADTREGWVKIEVETNPATDAFHVIFNDGETTESVDLVIDDITNVYLINKANGTYPSYQAAEEALSSAPVVRETVTIHYHKKDAWSDTVKAYAYMDSDTYFDEPLGGWGEYTATAEGDGWYTIKVPVEKDKISDGCNIIIYDSESETINRVVTTINSNDEIWIAQDGHKFTSRADAEEYEGLEKSSYTIYYYAPDWAEDGAIYVYTYDGSIGEIGGYDATPLSAVDEKDGWYSATFETALEVTSFNVIFHNASESFKQEFYASGLTGDTFYFIANGSGSFASFAAAESAYAYNKTLDESEKLTITLHLYAPEWTAVNIHTYGSYESGTWGTVFMMTDSEHEGWFTYTFQVPELKFAQSGINIIFFKPDESARIETYTNDTNYVYFSVLHGNDNKFNNMEDAMEEPEPEEEVTTEDVTIHLHKNSTWGATVMAYAYNNSEKLGPLLGSWGSYSATDDGDGWYTIILPVAEGKLASGSTVNLIIYDADATETKRIEIVVDSTDEIWLATDGQKFTSKEAVDEYEGLEKTTYNFYYYAPDWTFGTVYVYTYGGTLGEIGGFNATPMTAVDANPGWYVATFETALTFTDFNIIFHNDTDSYHQEFYINFRGSAKFYFIANGNQRYTSMTAAEAAYAENKEIEAGPKYTITLHLYAPGWELVKIHIYKAFETGAWGSVSMTADPENADWFTYTFEVPTGKFDDTGINVIFFAVDASGAELARMESSTTDTAYVYFNAFKGNNKKFASREEAMEGTTKPDPGPGTDPTEPDPDKTTYTIYYYAPEWPAGEPVYIYMWNGPGKLFGNSNKNTTMIAVADKPGWYSASFATADTVTDFNIMFNTVTESIKHQFGVSDLTGENFYFIYRSSNSGNVVYYSMEEAEEAYGPVAEPTQYTIYYYAPTWTDEVYAYVYGGLAGTVLGGYEDFATLTAVDGQVGWYSINFQTTIAVTGFSIIFHNEDDTIKHEFGVSGLVGTEFYFISNDDNAYKSAEEAQQAYDYNKSLDESEPISITLYLYAPEWSEAGVHIYNAYDTGAFGSVTMTAAPDMGEGWFSFTFEVAELAFTNKGINIIFFNAQDQSVRVETYTNDVEWVYFSASKGNDNKFTSKEDAEYETDPSERIYTIYYFAPEWPSDELVYIYMYNGPGTVFGKNGNTYMQAVEDKYGWYYASFEYDGVVDSFNIMFHTKDNSTVKHQFPVSDLTGNNFYFIYRSNNKDNAIYSSMEAAEEAYGPYTPTEPVTYTIYYYAPDWADEAIYAYVHGGSVGEILGSYQDLATLTAVQGKDGWYSITFDTLLAVTDFNVIFHKADDSVKHEFYVGGLVGEEFYFIANGNDVYTSSDDAEEAYELNKSIDESQPISVTLHLYAPNWDVAGIHIYNGYETGEFGSVNMTVDSDNEGWFTFTFEVAELAFTSKGINIIFFNAQDQSVRVETYTNDVEWVYFSALHGNDNKFNNMDDAMEEPEAPSNLYTIYYFAPDWPAGESLNIYLWNGPGKVFGNNNNTSMQPVDGKVGWYYASFEYDGTFDKFNIMFNTQDNTTIKHQFEVTVVTHNYYFIYKNSNKAADNPVYASMYEAEAAYYPSETPGPEQPGQQEGTEYTIYVYSPDVAGSNTKRQVNGTGEWSEIIKEVALAADGRGTGWYKGTFYTTKELDGTLTLEIVFGSGSSFTANTDSLDKLYFLYGVEDQSFSSKEETEAAYAETSNTAEVAMFNKQYALYL